MKYYLFEVADGDSKIAGISSAKFDSETKTDEQNYFDAESSALKRLEIAKSDLYKSDLVIISNEVGGVVFNKRRINPYWVEPTPNNPEPIDEE